MDVGIASKLYHMFDLKWFQTQSDAVESPTQPSKFVEKLAKHTMFEIKIMNVFTLKKNH